MVGRVTAMALSHCGWFEILGILGTEWVFYADNHPFSCGDVMRFTRLHSDRLFAGVHRRLGWAWSAPACFGMSPPGLGCVFWFHLLSCDLWGWFHDLRLLAQLPSRRCWCLPIVTSSALSHKPGWVQTMRTGTERGAAREGRINYPL